MAEHVVAADSIVLYQHFKNSLNIPVLLKKNIPEFSHIVNRLLHMTAWHAERQGQAQGCTWACPMGCKSLLSLHHHLSIVD